jgi:hypothetical protein
MWLHFSIEALIGSSEKSETLFNIRVKAPVATCPIRMLTKKANASRYKDFHVPSCPIRVTQNSFSVERAVEVDSSA